MLMVNHKSEVISNNSYLSESEKLLTDLLHPKTNLQGKYHCQIKECNILTTYTNLREEDLRRYKSTHTNQHVFS